MAKIFCYEMKNDLRDELDYLEVNLSMQGNEKIDEFMENGSESTYQRFKVNGDRIIQRLSQTLKNGDENSSFNTKNEIFVIGPNEEETSKLIKEIYKDYKECNKKYTL